MADQTLIKNNTNKMKAIIEKESVRDRMRNVLGSEAGTFLASVLDLYSSDSNLTECEPTMVMAQCMKAAALKLPISKTLGFAYIVPYKQYGKLVPQFQLGYRGMIQLALRSGKYRFLNADVVYEGESVRTNRITGILEISGEPKSDKVIGYFAYFQLLNGFEKGIYWSTEKVTAHAQRYSKSWKKENSPWHTNFDAMAIKTVLRNILSKYGVMSVEFVSALEQDYDEETEAQVDANANGEPLTLPDPDVQITDDTEEDQEPQEDEKPAADDAMADPGF